jgi:hypothetical protein
MIEITRMMQASAFEAELDERRERLTRDIGAARRAAYERRARRAALAQTTAEGRTHGLAAVLRGFRLPVSETWHAAR